MASPTFTVGLLIRFFFAFHASLVRGLRFDPAYEKYNLNQNQAATTPLEYWGEWEDHDYHPSPKNWRFPFYTLFLDRFVNGDPTNDNANGTLFEQDIMSTQLRHGGDIDGLVDTLDYIQGFGIKVTPESSGLSMCLLTRQGSVPCWFPFYQSAMGCGFVLGKHPHFDAAGMANQSSLWTTRYWMSTSVRSLNGGKRLMRSTVEGCTSFLITPLPRELSKPAMPRYLR
jgi:hypothetical protein